MGTLFLSSDGKTHLWAPDSRQPEDPGKGTRVRCGEVLRPAKSTDADESQASCLGCKMNLTLEEKSGEDAAALGDPPIWAYVSPLVLSNRERFEVKVHPWPGWARLGTGGRSLKNESIRE